jgi:hypothetical protein
MDTDRSSKKKPNSSAKGSKLDTKRSGKTEKEEEKKEVQIKQKSLFVYDKGIPKDAKEVLDSMDENQDKLKKLIDKGIKISNFIQFEADCEEILGVEINPIIDYFSYKYATTKDKFVLTFNDFIDLTQKWADSFVLNQHEEKETKLEEDHLEEEKLEMQVRSRDNLVLKFDRHKDKIREIFQNYAEKSAKIKPLDTSALDVANKEEKKAQESIMRTKNDFMKEKISPQEIKGLQVKLKFVDKIFDDIAYLAGISIMSYVENLEGVNTKKSSQLAKEEVVHYFWKRVHDSELEDLRKTKKSIYKSTPNDKKVDPEKKKQSEKPTKVVQKDVKKVDQNPPKEEHNHPESPKETKTARRIY